MCDDLRVPQPRLHLRITCRWILLGLLAAARSCQFLTEQPRSSLMPLMAYVWFAALVIRPMRWSMASLWGAQRVWFVFPLATYCSFICILKYCLPWWWLYPLVCVLVLDISQWSCSMCSNVWLYGVVDYYNISKHVISNIRYYVCNEKWMLTITLGWWYIFMLFIHIHHGLQLLSVKKLS